MKVLIRYGYQYKETNDPAKYFEDDTVMLEGENLNMNTLLQAFRDFLMKKRDRLLKLSNSEKAGSVVIDRRYKTPSRYLVKGSIVWFLPEFEKRFFKQTLLK